MFSEMFLTALRVSARDRCFCFRLDVVIVSPSYAVRACALEYENTRCLCVYRVAFQCDFVASARELRINHFIKIQTTSLIRTI